MLFSSIPFLFYFLPCVFVLYFLVPMRWKNTVLLLASLFFYAWGEPKFVVFMLASIVQGYVLARLVEKYRADRGRAKLFLTLSLVFSLGLLGYCKYADFPRGAAHRHQLLYVSDPQLCGGRLPRRREGAA